MAALALPSFLGSPEDKTKVVDAYSEVSSKLRTSLSSKIDVFSSGLDGAFDKAVGITKGIGEKLRTNAIDLPSAIKRVQGALAGSRSDITKIASATEKLIMGELTGTDTSTNYVKSATDIARGVEIIVGDGRTVIDTLKNGGYNQVSSIVNFISDLTGSSLIKTYDLGAEAAILRGVIEEVSGWGIPTLIDSVMKDQSDITKYTVIKRSAERISASSSLDVLLAYANVNGTSGLNIGANALNANTPDFATKVLSNFAFVEGVTVADYPTQLAKLVELMNKLKPNWFWTVRGDQQVWNLGTLANASENAVTLFLSSPVYRDAILTAPFYQPARVEELVNTMYPLTTTD